MTLQSKNKNGVEILCIGTELLLGDILNSNARWLAKELASLGLPHYWQTVVGDNSERIKEAVIHASKRSHVLITTGGLGTTPDDLTTETLASIFNTNIEERPDIMLAIERKLSSQGRTPNLSDRKQACLPAGAKSIPNPTGLAAGMIWSPEPGFTLLTFPGVPSEMKKMWIDTAVPWFYEHGEVKETFSSKVLKFAGISESALAEDLSDLLLNHNPTIAPYAGVGEVKLRLTAKAKSVSDAKRLIRPIEEELKKRMGVKCFGEDHQTLAGVVFELLGTRDETLSVAESCTGGSLGTALVAIPGASKVFKGGVIAYQNSIKKRLLGVPEELIKSHGAVSKAVVEAMASGVRKRLNTDWGIAISGVAGPKGGTDSKPVGTVHLAIAGPKGIESIKKNFGSHKTRLDIQQLSVVCSLNRLRLNLLAQS